MLAGIPLSAGAQEVEKTYFIGGGGAEVPASPIRLDFRLDRAVYREYDMILTEITLTNILKDETLTLTGEFGVEVIDRKTNRPYVWPAEGCGIGGLAPVVGRYVLRPGRESLPLVYPSQGLTVSPTEQIQTVDSIEGSSNSRIVPGAYKVRAIYKMGGKIYTSEWRDFSIHPVKVIPPGPPSAPRGGGVNPPPVETESEREDARLRLNAGKIGENIVRYEVLIQSFHRQEWARVQNLAQALLDSILPLERYVSVVTFLANSYAAQGRAKEAEHWLLVFKTKEEARKQLEEWLPKKNP